MIRQAPVKQEFFRNLPSDVQLTLKANGAVPINGVFFDLWWAERCPYCSTPSHDMSKIWLLYGGYGSGKTNFIADWLIDECMNTTYFKCLFGRKVLESVRNTIFSTIVSRIEARGLQSKFSYSKKPKSSMIIMCIENENVFLPFGSDNPEKLLSLDDPTHILCEEFDQFSFDDFKVLLPRLRTAKAPTKFIGNFNSTRVKKSHWIAKFFFDPELSFNDKLRAFIPDADYSLKTLFCNYTNNFFFDQKAYAQTLWVSAGFNQQKFSEIASGAWGSEDTTNRWAWAFTEEKHVVNVMHPDGAQFMKIEPNLPLKLSFDFNVDPMTCLVFQHNGTEWLKVYREYRLENSDIYAVLEQIKTEFGPYFKVATGDASGKARNGNVRGKKSYIQTIRTELDLSPRQTQFPSKNPAVADTRMVVNAMFVKMPVYISSACQYLILDLSTIIVDDKGEIDKSKEERKKRNHLLDCFRYIGWNYFRSLLTQKK